MQKDLGSCRGGFLGIYRAWTLLLPQLNSPGSYLGGLWGCYPGIFLPQKEAKRSWEVPQRSARELLDMGLPSVSTNSQGGFLGIVWSCYPGFFLPPLEAKCLQEITRSGPTGATTCGTASNIPKIPREAALKEYAAITLELQLSPEKAKETPGDSWEESQAATGYGSSSRTHETPRGAPRSWGLLRRIFPPSTRGKKKLGDAWEESRGVTHHGPASYLSKAKAAS